MSNPMGAVFEDGVSWVVRAQASSEVACGFDHLHRWAEQYTNGSWISNNVSFVLYP